MQAVSCRLVLSADQRCLLGSNVRIYRICVWHWMCLPAAAVLGRSINYLVFRTAHDAKDAARRMSDTFSVMGSVMTGQ